MRKTTSPTTVIAGETGLCPSCEEYGVARARQAYQSYGTSVACNYVCILCKYRFRDIYELKEACELSTRSDA